VIPELSCCKYNKINYKHFSPINHTKRFRGKDRISLKTKKSFKIFSAKKTMEECFQAPDLKA
jgi:hypothetical protein